MKSSFLLSALKAGNTQFAHAGAERARKGEQDNALVIIPLRGGKSSPFLMIKRERHGGETHTLPLFKIYQIFLILY